MTLDMNHTIQRMLPGTALSANTLPLVPEIRLWLIDGDVLTRPLTLEEQNRVADYPCYWAICWASGHRLARYILDHPELVKGKSVIDVGCGSGVIAIAAALAGASRVVACDLDTVALEAASANAQLNNVTLDVNDHFFNLTAQHSNTEQPPLIIAADLLYDRSNLPLIDDFLALSPDVWIADSRISDFSHPAFRYIGPYSSANEPQSDGYDEFQTMHLYQSHAVYTKENIKMKIPQPQ